MNIIESLQQAGANVRHSDMPQHIACPFCGLDGRPSMRVYPATNSAYCFKCKESYNGIAVYAKNNGISYGQAMSRLGLHYGKDYVTKQAYNDDLMRSLEDSLITGIQTLPDDVINPILTLSASGEPARNVLQLVNSALGYTINK